MTLVWRRPIGPKWSARLSTSPCRISWSPPAALRKEPIADADSRQYPGQVGQQSASDRMAHALHAHGSKVDGDDIEGRFGTSLNRRCHEGRKAIDAKVLHSLDQHGPGCAS